MVSDGVENCLLYIDNFDPEKSQNPFAYFTQIIYYAFLRRIQKEKKHLYIKYKSMQNEVINSLIENNGEDNVMTHLNGALHDSYSEEFIRDFIETFETNKKNRIVKTKPQTKKIKKAKNNLETFLEIDNADTYAGST